MRLKAIKYNKKNLYYLSIYIRFLFFRVYFLIKLLYFIIKDVIAFYIIIIV